MKVTNKTFSLPDVGSNILVYRLLSCELQPSRDLLVFTQRVSPDLIAFWKPHCYLLFPKVSLPLWSGLTSRLCLQINSCFISASNTCAVFSLLFISCFFSPSAGRALVYSRTGWATDMTAPTTPRSRKLRRLPCWPRVALRSQTSWRDALSWKSRFFSATRQKKQSLTGYTGWCVWWTQKAAPAIATNTPPPAWSVVTKTPEPSA